LRFADQDLDISGTRVTVARVISRVTPAPLFNLYVGIVVAFSSPIGLGPNLDAVSSLTICFFLMVILPAAPIVYEAMKGRIDLDVSEQAMRTRFFLAAILFYIAAYGIYSVLECRVMAVLALAYVTVTIGIMIITWWSKVSVHCAGVGGPGTAIIIVYGVLGLPVILVWIAVVWSRPVLRQHTLKQAVIGLVAAVIITCVTYIMFW
jgi:hypothetical protein